MLMIGQQKVADGVTGNFPAAGGQMEVTPVTMSFVCHLVECQFHIILADVSGVSVSCHNNAKTAHKQHIKQCDINPSDIIFFGMSLTYAQAVTTRTHVNNLLKLHILSIW